MKIGVEPRDSYRGGGGFCCLLGPFQPSFNHSLESSHIQNNYHQVQNMTDESQFESLYVYNKTILEVAHHQSPSSMMLMIFFSSPGFQLQCSEAAPHSSNSHQGDIFLHHHHHHVSHLHHHYHHYDEVWSCFTGSPSYFQEKLTLLARFFCHNHHHHYDDHHHRMPSSTGMGGSLVPARGPALLYNRQVSENISKY